MSEKLRSPSGDTDLLVLAVALLSEFKARVYFDSGVGDQRKFLWIGGIDMPEQHVKALTGFHAFTGNDYASSFFRKGVLCKFGRDMDSVRERIVSAGRICMRFVQPPKYERKLSTLQDV